MFTLRATFVHSYQPQVLLPGIGRVDFLLDGLLIIEIDGFAFHSKREDMRRDRNRNNSAASHDDAVLRNVPEHIWFTPQQVIADITGRDSTWPGQKESPAGGGDQDPENLDGLVGGVDPGMWLPAGEGDGITATEVVLLVGQDQPDTALDHMEHVNVAVHGIQFRLTAAMRLDAGLDDLDPPLGTGRQQALHDSLAAQRDPRPVVALGQVGFRRREEVADGNRQDLAERHERGHGRGREIAFHPAQEPLGEPGGVGNLFDGEPLGLPCGPDPGPDGNGHVARLNWQCLHLRTFHGRQPGPTLEQY
ncbi:hypothetical protein ARTHRO9AX_70074 [Arthrobacter sp. 9AX]|nr:hypothetical protein ARTHRO9AX_70074 [Arthrobacter sp. 9AX]